MIGFILFSPIFLLRREKYAAGFRQRLGKLPEFAADKRPVIWIHCVSVGETNAARPLIAALKNRFPAHRLVVSTVTKTGQELAKKIFADQADLIFYFPFDFKFSVRRALRKINPQVVLLLETELWFNFLREADRHGAKTVIVNGRLSEKSARRYALLKNFMRRALHYVNLALMQNNTDAKRLTNLGITANKVRVTGNLKFDLQLTDGEEKATAMLRRRFDISAAAPLIIAASTHAPEEKLILQAFKEIWKDAGDKLPRLMIAPRHPERFGAVAEEIAKTGFAYTRRAAPASERDRTAEIILLDSIGELRAAYALAEIVFVGGSLIPRGGQSVLEPAAAGKAVVTGFYTMNFAAAVREFSAKNALIQLPELAENEIPAKLAEVFRDLLENCEKRGQIGFNAAAVMQKNRGATEKTVEYLEALIK